VCGVDYGSITTKLPEIMPAVFTDLGHVYPLLGHTNDLPRSECRCKVVGVFNFYEIAFGSYECKLRLDHERY